MTYQRAGCILIINKDNGTFLSVSNKKRTDFNLPGGKIEAFESILDGSIRELKEETGLNVNKGDLTKFYHDWCREYGCKWDVYTYLSFNYSGEICTNERGIVKWLPLEELKNSKQYSKYNSELYNKYVNNY